MIGCQILELNLRDAAVNGFTHIGLVLKRNDSYGVMHDEAILLSCLG